MTTTTKLNPRELLSQLANSNSSGCLELEEGLVSWKIYLQQGKLKYIDCSVQSLDQLKYYLRHLGLKQALNGLKGLLLSDNIKLESYVPEKSSQQNSYSKVICWLLAEKHLDSPQGLKLIEQITKDALSSCLWLDKGTSLWQDGYSLPLWIKVRFNDTLSVNLSECLQIEQNRLKQWQQNCSDRLLSVHQRPYFAHSWEQQTLPTSGVLKYKTLQELTQVIRGRTSVRQLSLLLQKDELHVAKILSPYINNEIIQLRNPQPPLDRLPNVPRRKQNIKQSLSSSSSTSNNDGHENPENSAVKTWKIVCIDDSPTILKEIQRFLDPKKFEVTAIDDPVKATSIIFRINPDLILLDITMPRINGYRLCGLLRDSYHCAHTPIIMVTGNTGLIDKTRAKLAGATDYFTKPFTQEGLNKIVAKHLPEFQ